MGSKMMRYWALTGMAGLLVGGCAVGPDYDLPKLGMPLGWLGVGHDDLVKAGEAQVNLDWWKAFDDPVLDGLMQQALVRNGDLRMARARVEEARGARLAAQAALLPSVDGAARGARGNASASGQLVTTRAAEFDANWEFDLFGGNRRAAEAARARLGGARAEMRLAQVRLVAEVARVYLDVRRLQQQVLFAQKNLADQTETLRLVQAQQREGVVSNLNVAQSEALVASTAAAVPLLEANLSSNMNALGVLVGAQPQEIKALVDNVKPVPVATPQVVVAVPATVIGARPDVAAAERRLAAAVADQGVALANWFPRISLTGLFGLQDFGNGSQEGWNVGGVVSLPLLDFGRVRALVRQADARQVQALADYEQTVLAALADVESSLSAYVKAVEREQKLRVAAEASRNALRLAKLQYMEGVASNLDVIVAEQQQLTADDVLAGGQAAVGQALAALYKALGGGV